MVYTDRQRLTADYIQELVEFGRAIGIDWGLLRDLNAGCQHCYFKIDGHQLAAALKRGAIAVSREEIVLYMYRMRRIGEREMFAEQELAEGLPVINTDTGQTELI